MIFRLEGEGEEGGGASGSRNLYGTTIEESTSIEVGSEFSEEDVMNFRDALHGKAAFSGTWERILPTYMSRCLGGENYDEFLNGGAAVFP